MRLKMVTLLAFLMVVILASGCIFLPGHDRGRGYGGSDRRHYSEAQPPAKPGPPNHGGQIYQNGPDRAPNYHPPVDYRYQQGH